MTQEQFMEHLIGLAKNKLAMFNSLSEETGCYWSEIQDNRFDFEVNRNEALALRSLTKEYVLAAFDEWLLPLNGGKRCERRALVVQVIGAATKPAPKEDQASNLNLFQCISKGRCVLCTKLSEESHGERSTE
jgi:secreted Zn-dependent insulinase-like peptidase